MTSIPNFAKCYETNHNWLRVMCALTAIILLVTASPAAFADCPADGACYTKKEAQTCLVCLHERDALRQSAQKKEDERNSAIGQQNALSGQLTECRVQRTAFDMERLHWRDVAHKEARRPSWLTVVSVGVGALLIGGATGWIAGAF